MPTKKKNPDEEIKFDELAGKGGNKKKPKPKAKKKKKPTKLQKKVADKIKKNAEQGGNKSLAKILKESGASFSLQNTPKKITGKKSFQDYLNAIIPPDVLAQLQARQLGARNIQTIAFPIQLDPGVISDSLAAMDFVLLDFSTAPMIAKHFATVAVPDHRAIGAALKMVHEIQGNIKPPDDGDEEKRQSALVVVEQLQIIMQGGQGVMPKLIKNAKQ